MTQTENAVEKIYSKIDEDLGEDHVRDVVQNLVNAENNKEAYSNLMKLHEQCCAVFARYPNQNESGKEKKDIVKQRKSMPVKK